jgi:hypothetical protein
MSFGHRSPILATPAWAVPRHVDCLACNDDVDSIRVSDLTDDTIASILADLPESIDVVHHIGGEVELKTRGRDISRWLRSRAHDPSDRDVRRYRVVAWHYLSEPMSWRELVNAGYPMLGFSIRDAVVEIRRADVGKTILLGAAMVSAAMIVEVISWIQAVHFPDSEPSTPREPTSRVRGDTVLDDASRATEPAPITWTASSCDAVSRSPR